MDTANKVVFVVDSKTPTGVSEVPMTDLAADAFQDQLEFAGPGPWLFLKFANARPSPAQF